MMPGDDDLERIKALDEKLARAGAPKKDKSGDAAGAGEEAENMGNGMRASAELIVPIVVGTFAGFQIDKWLDSKPAGLIVMLLLGIGAGFWNVYKATQATTVKTVAKKSTRPLQNVEKISTTPTDE